MSAEVAVCRDYWKEYGGNSGLIRMPGGRWKRAKNFHYIRKPGWNRYEGELTKAMQRALAEPAPVIDCRIEFSGQLLPIALRGL